MNHSRIRCGAATRRSVLRALGAAVGVWLAAPRRGGWAASPARLSEKDPAAVVQGYVADAARVDAARFPQFVKGSNCENCLQLQGRAGDAYRPCSIFPGKLVASPGWCKSWTPEM
jgi:hypothetical protein